MKNREIPLVALLMFILFFLNSCISENSDDLKKKSSSSIDNTVCNDTSNIKYAIDIVPILRSECYVCHSNGSTNGQFEDHADLINYVNSNEFWGRINHLSGYKPMPNNNKKLSKCQLKKIDIWIKNGALNN